MITRPLLVLEGEGNKITTSYIIITVKDRVDPRHFYDFVAE